ncbi:MAG TPA: DUF4118 domain-containing protein, partial [Isosphaeraceae bacterium]|nr:DUF4118 domain-containing protein [Isosphaeraceae bacterium]
MRNDSRHTVIAYCVAVLSVGTVLLLRLLLAPLVGLNFPLLLFLVAVVLSSWYGGFGPGLLATLLSALLGDYFLMGPDVADLGIMPGRFTRLALFSLQGMILS